MEPLRHVQACFAMVPDAERDGVLVYEALRELETEVLGSRARRIGSLSRLAAAAAGACAKDVPEGLLPAPERLAVFHGTAMGNVQETSTTFFQASEHPESMPSPLNFSRSVAHLTLFYIARVTGARGPCLLLSQEDRSFEAALRAAFDHDGHPFVDAAFVGASDSFAPPASSQEARLDAPPGTRFGEGSAWMLLTREPAGARGTWLDEGVLGGRDELADLLRDAASRRRDDEPLHLAPGLRIDEDDLAAARAGCDGALPRSYLERTGWNPSAAGQAAALALTEGPAGLHLHLSRDAVGRLAFHLLRVHPR